MKTNSSVKKLALAAVFCAVAVVAKSKGLRASSVVWNILFVIVKKRVVMVGDKRRI